MESWLGSLFLLSFVLIVPGVYTVDTCFDGVVTDVIAYQSNSTYFQTPNYPYAYPNNFHCGVRIVAENDVDPIKIRVLNSSLDKVEDLSTCTLDFAEIYDGHDPSFPKLVQWCGDSTPTVTTSGPYAFFFFQTDASVTGGGIYLEFTTGTLAVLTTVQPVTTTTEAPDNSGAIAGGVVGGLIGLAALVVGIVFLSLYCIKRSKSKIDSEKVQLRPARKSSKTGGESNILVISEKPSKDGVAIQDGRPQSKDQTRPQSRVSLGGRNSRLMTANSFSDTPGTLTPAFSPTPPRTPKGSIRLIESRLRLHSEMGSPATPPPSHREILRSSAITIASVNSQQVSRSRNFENGDTPVILEDANPSPE